MKLSRSRILAVSTTAVVAMLAAGIHQASAQNLFQRLIQSNQYGRAQTQVQQPEQASPAPAESGQRAALPRVSGPSYYTYKTDPLVRVDFSGITPERGEDTTMLSPDELDRTSVASTRIDEEAQADRVDDVLDAAAEAIEEQAAEASPDAGPSAEDDLAAAPLAETEADAETTATSDEPAEDAAEASPNAEPEAEDGLAAAPEAEAAEDLTATAPDEALADDNSTAISRQAGEEDASALPEVETVDLEAAPLPLTDAQIVALQEFELLAEKEAAEAIVAHYTASPEFIWVSDEGPSERAQAALRVLADASSHGLDPRDYAVSTPRAGDATAAAAFEMELSARVLRYVRDAQSGRVDPNRISGYHDFAAKELDRTAILREASESDDIATFLESHHPGNAHYAALRAELAELRVGVENEIVIAPNTLIRPGETNAEFSKILTLVDAGADEAFRAEHGELLAQHLGSDVYARELVPVVKAAQSAAGVGSDGVIGPRTIHALAGDSRAGRIEKVQIALEQARWLPSDLSDRHVFINTPAFNAVYVEDGEEKLSMRTVVGNLRTQTYFFQDEIQYVEFHPYWGVPRSILVNTYLPRLMNDPSYLDRSGFDVVNSRGQRVSSSSIDWARYGANIPYSVRQRPGSRNALGELKIMFPNRHAIYMHDTPDKHLFDRDNRALSNGCIRLDDPRGMAAAVLGWSREELDTRLAAPHSREDLSVKVPVYVAYFTAWPDASGEVLYFDDVYSRDAKTREAIDMVQALRAPGA